MEQYTKGKYNNMIAFSDPGWIKAENGGLKCAFHKDNVFPTRLAPFGNFYMRIPTRPIPTLNSCYGSDWSSVGYMEIDHTTGEWINGKKHKLQQHDFISQTPPKDTAANLFSQQTCKITTKKYNKSIKKNNK